MTAVADMRRRRRIHGCSASPSLTPSYLARTLLPRRRRARAGQGRAHTQARRRRVRPSKADVDAAVEALKVLKVEVGAAARKLREAIGAGAGAVAWEELRQASSPCLARPTSLKTHASLPPMPPPARSLTAGASGAASHPSVPAAAHLIAVALAPPLDTQAFPVLDLRLILRRNLYVQHVEIFLYADPPSFQVPNFGFWG